MIQTSQGRINIILDQAALGDFQFEQLRRRCGFVLYRADGCQQTGSLELQGRQIDRGA